MWLDRWTREVQNNGADDTPKTRKMGGLSSDVVPKQERVRHARLPPFAPPRGRDDVDFGRWALRERPEGSAHGCTARDGSLLQLHIAVCTSTDRILPPGGGIKNGMGPAFSAHGGDGFLKPLILHNTMAPTTFMSGYAQQCSAWSPRREIHPHHGVGHTHVCDACFDCMLMGVLGVGAESHRRRWRWDSR